MQTIQLRWDLKLLRSVHSSKYSLKGIIGLETLRELNMIGIWAQIIIPLFTRIHSIIDPKS